MAATHLYINPIIFLPATINFSQHVLIAERSCYLALKEKSHDYFYKAYQDFYGIPFDPATFDYETVEIKFSKTMLNKEIF